MTEWLIVYTVNLLIDIAWFAIVFVFLNTQKKKAVTDDEFRHAKEITASGVDYYKKLDHMLQDIRVLRHDYKYQIGVIEELAKISNAKHINEFLESTKTRFVATEPVVYCENIIVSALLANYAERFIANNITFQIQAALPSVLPENSNHAGDILDNYEICIVLGNLLENSLEGVMTIPSDDRHVSLSMRLAGAQLLIEVTNSFDGKIFLTDGNAGLPVTRKGMGGGYGLKSIMAVCKRHSGVYLPQWTDKEYMVRILLNI